MSVFIHTLKTVRVFSPTVVEHDERFYIRLSDVAYVLGVKQPFAFASDVKEFLGWWSILKGEKTEPFRGKEDNARTLYVEVHNLVFYLQCARVKQPLSQGNKRRLIQELEAFI